MRLLRTNASCGPSRYIAIRFSSKRLPSIFARSAERSRKMPESLSIRLRPEPRITTRGKAEDIARGGMRESIRKSYPGRNVKHGGARRPAGESSEKHQQEQRAPKQHGQTVFGCTIIRPDISMCKA